jgi:hypothetical protein
MGQAVSHAGDLSPRQIGLTGEQFGRERLHRLADLDQPYANGVEDQRIAQLAAAQVCSDGVNGARMSSRR